MLKFLRAFILALVLIAVALLSALTAMRLAIHGREVKVPRFIGMTLPQAQSEAGARGLIVSSDSKFYSSDVPEGRIVGQSPEPGTRVRSGWRVRLAESLGPQQIQVPDLIGQSPRAAAINAQRRGLELSTIAQAALPGAAADQIIAQSPQPNAPDIAAPKLMVLLAAPQGPKQYVMPDFTGRQLADVVPLINNAGLQLGAVTERSTAPAPGATSDGTLPAAGAHPRVHAAERAEPPITGIIVKQSPAAGSRVTQGDTLTFEIAH